MTAEEFVAHRQEKRAKAGEAIKELGRSLHPDWDPYKEQKIPEEKRTRSLRDETTRISNEEKASQTKRRNLAMDAYEAKKEKTNVLPINIPFTGSSQNVNMDNTETSASDADWLKKQSEARKAKWKAEDDAVLKG